VSDLYSDAHPEYEDDEAVEVVPPEQGEEPENGASTPPTDNFVTAANVMVAQSYVFKGLLFGVIMAMVAFYIRRSRSPRSNGYEKSIA